MEYQPISSFQMAIKYWWLIFLCTFVGGFGGFLFSQSHPPEYRAVASFYVTIDMDQLAQLNLPVDQFQYNEDLALSSTLFTLRTDVVLDKVVQSLNQKEIIIDVKTLRNNHRLDRNHAIWNLEFIHSNPSTAVQVVNEWAEAGYEMMVKNQNAGLISGYVNFSPPNLAENAEGPVIYNRNYLILVGSLLGFIGVILGLEIKGLINQ